MACNTCNTHKHSKRFVIACTPLRLQKLRVQVGTLSLLQLRVNVLIFVMSTIFNGAFFMARS